MSDNLFDSIFASKFGIADDTSDILIKDSFQALLSFNNSFTIKKPGFHFSCFEPISNFRYVLCGTDEGYIGLWNVAERKKEPVYFFQSQRSNILSVKQLSENVIVSGSNSGDFSVIEIGNERFSRTTFVCHHSKAVTGIEPIDNNTFLTVSLDSTVHIVDKRMQYPYTISTNSKFDDTLGPLNDISFRSPQCFGGPYPPLTETDKSSLFIDFSHVHNSEIYQITPALGYNSYTIANGRSEAKNIDIRAPEVEYSELLGFTVLPKTCSHLPVTSICYDEYKNYFSMSLQQHSTFTFASDHISKIPDTDKYNIQIIDIFKFKPEYYKDYYGYIEKNGCGDGTECQYQDLFHVFGFCQRNYHEVGRFMNEFQFSLYKTLALHTTSYYCDYLVAGSQLGSIFIIDSKTHEIVNILQPSDQPINHIATSTNFYGFGASTYDAIYIYEISNPYKVNKENKLNELDEKFQEFNKIFTRFSQDSLQNLINIAFYGPKMNHFDFSF